jgi:hypothetical protein
VPGGFSPRKEDNEGAVAVDVEQLKPDARVRFPGHSEPVTLVAVKPGPFYDFFFIGPTGPDRITLAEDELGGVEIVEVVSTLPFDGDPIRFRLGIEARRTACAASRTPPRSAATRSTAPTGGFRYRGGSATAIPTSSTG